MWVVETNKIKLQSFNNKTRTMFASTQQGWIQKGEF